MQPSWRRGTGKSDKEGFHTAAFWLFRNHPRTLGCSVGSFADFGYFKDLPEILYRLLEGSDVRLLQKLEWQQHKGLRDKKRTAFILGRAFGQRRKGKKKLREPKLSLPKEVLIALVMARTKQEQEKARAIRMEKKIAMAKR